MKQKLNKQTKSNCWKIALSNLLNISPKVIPDFTKLYNNNFVIETRKWLNRQNKTIVYIPFELFLETGDPKYNPKIFPQGKCIAFLGKSNEDDHTVLMVDGELMENPSGETYDNIWGYFIIYNL
jgi:hypothetical protein